MRERRYVKFKLDLYDDTKTKIIDQKPERDFIHYFFARSIILAGKTDKEGDLYMAEDIPYTIDTLAIEFGRDAVLIKVALDVLIELKMIVVTADNVYRVKGFVKHQNIKVKEKEEIKSISQSNKEVDIKEDKQTEDREIVLDKIQEECKPAKNQEKEQNETNQGNLVGLETKNNSKERKKNKSEQKDDLVTELAVDEKVDDTPLLLFYDGDMPPLQEGEKVIWGQSLA